MVVFFRLFLLFKFGGVGFNIYILGRSSELYYVSVGLIESFCGFRGVREGDDLFIFVKLKNKKGYIVYKDYKVNVEIIYIWKRIYILFVKIINLML